MENVLILASIILGTAINHAARLPVVMWIVTACVVLHNLLSIRLGRGQFQMKNMSLNLDDVLQGIQMPGRNASEAAKVQQSVLADYFRNAGAVPWQMDMSPWKT